MKVQFPPIAGAAIAAASIIASQLLTPLPLQATSATQRYNTVGDIPKEMIENHATLYGKVVKVTDGDTVRIRHLPNYPRMEEEDTNPSSSQSKTKLSETTLPIRFYGIDTPEIAKDGNPGMAHADDATHYTKRKISESGQIVNVKILSKDRYDRIVGVVTTTNPPGFDLSKGLASEGLASLYNGKGAEYDGKRQDLMMAIQTAQRMKKGIWENGILGVQSPAEYKKKH